MAVDKNGKQIVAPTMLIEQIRPDGESNAVELKNASMVQRGVATEVRQRIITSWPPGADQPIHQMMGVELAPVRFSGVLDDGALAATGLTQSIVGLLTRMVAEAFEVRVVFGEVWEYTGHIKTFRPIWRSSGSADWEMEIEPSTCNLLTRTDYKVQARRQQTDADIERSMLQVAIATAAIRATQISLAQTRNLASITMTAAGV